MLEPWPSVWLYHCIWKWGLSEVTKVKWGHKAGALTNRTRPQRKRMSSLPLPREDIARRWPSQSWGKSSHWNPTMLAPWPWTLHIQIHGPTGELPMSSAQGGVRFAELTLLPGLSCFSTKHFLGSNAGGKPSPLMEKAWPVCIAHLDLENKPAFRAAVEGA